MSDDALLRFSEENRSLRVEREANGDILVMTPTGCKTGKLNLRIGRFLDEWAERDGRGVACDSSTGFRLPSGAVRSPDAAWILKERDAALNEREQEGFGPICPDFVIELTSPSDEVSDVWKKITQEWIAGGAQLAWLIDAKNRTVTIFRPNEEPETRLDPTSVQGDGPVRGFELVMSRVWGN
jgi:Uma2 family endonuclease